MRCIRRCSSSSRSVFFSADLWRRNVDPTVFNLCSLPCCGVRYPFIGDRHRKSHPTKKMLLNLSTDLSNDVSILEEQTIYIFAAVVLSFIGFFGFILNLLVIITVVKNASVLWTPNNVVLVNMVVSICISILIIK